MRKAQVLGIGLGGWLVWATTGVAQAQQGQRTARPMPMTLSEFVRAYSWTKPAVAAQQYLAFKARTVQPEPALAADVAR